MRKRLARTLDLFIAVPAFLAAVFLHRVRRAGLEVLPITRRALRAAKTLPVIDHYYEPMIDFRQLTAPLSRPRVLPGIQWNEAGQKAFLKELEPFAAQAPCVPNDQFVGADADYWYCFLRCTKPKRIIEIGSGFSTRIAREAIADSEIVCDHICVEPYERAWLEQTGAKIIRKRVEQADPNMFASLQSGDVLFIDSSHMIRPQGDVLTEILDILPRLSPGVIVHFHDIFSPRDYLEQWVVECVRLWNEQYLLEAFLSENLGWKIIGALNYMAHQFPDELGKVCRSFTPGQQPGSFYIQKL